MNGLTKQLMHSAVQGDELMHYGVMGMHWGVRRYQPYPAAYDGDGKFIGKKALKKQVKADKEAIDKLTKETSILGSGLTAASKRREKADAKADKILVNEPEFHQYMRDIASGNVANIDISNFSKKARKTITRMLASEANENYIRKKHDEGVKKLNEMITDYRSKYGEKNVRDLIYDTDKYGNVVLNERVNSWKEWAKAQAISSYVLGATTLASLASGGAIPPLVGIGIPSSRKGKGKAGEEISYQVFEGVIKKALDDAAADSQRKKLEAIRNSSAHA